MKSEIAQALLNKILNIPDTDAEKMTKIGRYFQNMARYKFDDYHQYYPGMRFLEKLALWLNQFDENDRDTALEFIEKKMVFISHAEMNLLVSSVFPDKIKGILITKIASEKNIPYWKINDITSTQEYKALKRKCLFCGLSDGARTEVFRRSNPGVISHEQVYLTYELSVDRAKEMSKNLKKDLKDIYGAEPSDKDSKFEMLFLLDDFSASGTSYFKYKENEEIFKGKIAQLYNNIYNNKEEFGTVFDLENLQVHVVIYMCTKQAIEQILETYSNAKWPHKNLHITPIYEIDDSVKLNKGIDDKYIDLCNNPQYYDKDGIEDPHTGSNIQLGYGQCSLPIVLGHNTPNNSVPLLWSYDNCEKFKGLFPRIPRHKEL